MRIKSKKALVKTKGYLLVYFLAYMTYEVAHVNKMMN